MLSNCPLSFSRLETRVGRKGRELGRRDTRSLPSLMPSKTTLAHVCACTRTHAQQLTSFPSVCPYVFLSPVSFFPPSFSLSSLLPYFLPPPSSSLFLSLSLSLTPFILSHLQLYLSRSLDLYTFNMLKELKKKKVDEELNEGKIIQEQKRIPR